VRGIYVPRGQVGAEVYGTFRRLRRLAPQEHLLRRAAALPDLECVARWVYSWSRGQSMREVGMKLRLKALLALVAALAALGSAGAALADQPPGQLGYEGQPGNQGGPQHHP
jgi:hypothetical protein